MRIIDLFYKSRNKLTAIKPEGVEVCVQEDLDGKPLRYLYQDFYLQKIQYIFIMQLNHLNIRINYMLANGEKDKALPFLAEMRELSDALEFGTTYEKLKIQEWANSKLGLKNEIMYSLR